MVVEFVEHVILMAVAVVFMVLLVSVTVEAFGGQTRLILSFSYSSKLSDHHHGPISSD